MWTVQYRKHWVSLSAGLLVLAIYLPTVSRDLTWLAHSGDGGELITAAVTLGIPHPPGYPTYVLLGKLASFLPFEPIAYRFHLLSALCAALAAALVTATVQELRKEPASSWQRLLAVVPGCLFAFSPLVWQQARVAEVYTLNLTVVAIFIWLLLRQKPSPFITGLFFGLSLTTHLTSVLLLPLGLAHTPAKSWGRFFLGALLGTTPFLLLPVLARQGSPVIWGDPTTLRGWFWLITAQIYQPNQLALPRADAWLRLVEWGQPFLWQLMIVGWPLLVFAGWQQHNGRSSLPPKTWWLLVGTAVAYLLYAFFYRTSDAIVLTLPAWLILSLSLEPALKQVGKWALVLPGAALLLHLSSNTGANIHNIRAEAEHILSVTPAEAILVTSGDPDIFAMWYFHHVENQRPDITLVDSGLFAFDWYRHNLTRQYPYLRALQEDNLPLFETENRLDRAVCYAHFFGEPVGTRSVRCVEGSN